MALSRKDVLLLNTHTAVPHARFGNERSWSVTGGDLKRGQIVTLHAMCTAKTAIKAAIKQDAAEQAVTCLTPGCNNKRELICGKPAGLCTECMKTPMHVCDRTGVKVYGTRESCPMCK